MTERSAPEQRTIDVDVTDVDTRGRTLHGYAAVYGAISGDLGGFRETIAAGAFRDVIGADVRCLLNHDPSQVLGRTRSGTLRLADEQRGLRFECDLPDSPLGENVRAAVRRGDIDGASFRFVVGDEEWDGDIRTVRSVQELQDVTVATYGAYPDASVELRTRSTQTAASERQEVTEVDENTTTTEVPAEERAANEAGESREDTTGGDSERSESESRSEGHAGGGLRVEDRRQGGGRGLAAAFQARGWPAERATLDWDEFRAECRALTVSADPDDVNQVHRQSAPLGFDQRYAWPVFPQVGVGRDVTSVTVLQATFRELPVSGVVRDIDVVTEKAETDSTVDDVVTSLKQVASVQKGIPNIYLEQPAFRTVIEQDLRFALDGGLDGLVLDAIAASDNQAPGSDPLLVSIRKAITVVEASGYNPDIVVLRPQDAQALDTLVTGLSGGVNDFVFQPASNAPRVIYGLNVRVTKSIPAPAVVAASSFGKLYASPVSLDRFEADGGLTNRSNVRLELNAAFGVERQDAAVRIAAS
ncbi:MAG: HK97 family phage prohead protease [Solirubrobacterales bacterium]